MLMAMMMLVVALLTGSHNAFNRIAEFHNSLLQILFRSL
jgi:hypothetical protein